MKFFNSVYSHIQNDALIATVSSYLSHREINNVELTERPHYFSSKKGEAFLEAIGATVPIAVKTAMRGNLGIGKHLKSEVESFCEQTYKTNLCKVVKDAIKKARRRGVIVPYEQSRRGKYVLIHFPFFNGTMRLKTCKRYDDVYWWCGTYRDLKVYACGNKKNRIDDKGVINEPLWDPSGSSSSQEFFDKINSYVLEESEKYFETNDMYFFDTLSNNLHDGTMRGCKENLYQGWYVMLLRCDYVRKENDCTEIFGSPVFVSYETKTGYGWYYVCKNKGKEYYLENCGELNGHCFKIEQPIFDLSYKRFSLNKKYAGYNYGYWIYRGHKYKKLCIREDVSLVSEAERKKIVNQKIDEDVISKIGELRAVCLTTRVLNKNLT